MFGLKAPTLSILVCSLTALWYPDSASLAQTEAPPAAQSQPADQPKAAVERNETLRNESVAALLASTDSATESQWLGSGKDRFLALYRADHSGETFANALILHDNLQNPDWPGVVRTLRQQLAAKGWNTLSIAVPDYRPSQKIPPRTATTDADAEGKAMGNDAAELDTEATEPPDMMPSYEPPGDSKAGSDAEIKAEDVPQKLDSRVRSATQYLAGKSPLPLVIIALGSSATLVTKQAQTLFLQDISGLVIIDPAPLPELKGFDESKDMTDLRIPVLDIAPEFYARSNPATRKQNATRLQHQGYQQRVIPGSSQDFTGYERVLLKAIRGWGETLFKP